MAEFAWTEEMSREYARYMEINVKNDHRPWAARIARDWPEVPAGATVVDVAGGPAFLLLEMAAHLQEPRLIVTDSSAIMLKAANERAAARNRQVETILCPAEKLKLPDHSADLALCKHFLRFVPDLEAVLREFKRILKPGGRAYCIDFNPEGPWLGSQLLIFWIQLTAPPFIRANFKSLMHIGRPASKLPAHFLAAGFARAEILHAGVSYLIRGEVSK